MRLYRHPGHAAQLDEQHRPQRRLRHQGPRLPGDLPFNPWWTNHLHPDGAIGISYSDDLGRTWVTGNGGAYLDRVPNQSSKTFGGVEDKQWVAVNHIPGNRFQDHVYAAWAVFNGSATKVRMAISVTAARASPSRSP